MRRSKEFVDLMVFHHKFDMPENNHPTLLEDGFMKFRVDFMQEELDEIVEGFGENDLAKVADGLVDLVYVALGTAELMGLPWEELWDEVQRANMQKKRALRPEDSRRFSAYDVVKPDGWRPPDIEGVLKDYEEGRQPYSRIATVLRGGRKLPD